jgi:glucosamine--fructose-6-phosphate aminotransferase (isomerizing)
MPQFDDYLAQIRSLPDLPADLVERLEPPARILLSTPEIYGLRQIILTGSGDSYFACAAVAPAMRAWTGLPVQAMTAMEAARYIDGGSPQRSAGARGMLVISVSYSGEAARVVEATQRLRVMGAVTAAITANAESRLGQAAETILNTRIADFASAPGTRSYLASLVGLYLIAIRIAEVRITMTMDEANRLRRELGETGSLLDGLADRLSPAIERLAKAWRGFRTFDVLGSGPSLASASYAAAKLVEAAGVHATPQDAEEFHHLNYFVDSPQDIPTIVFAPARAYAATRTNELRQTLGQLGRPYCVVTDGGNAGSGDEILLLPTVREWFAPLLQTVPAALISAYSARERSVPHYRGHDGPWRGAQGAGLVKESRILSLEEQLTHA